MFQFGRSGLASVAVVLSLAASAANAAVITTLDDNTRSGAPSEVRVTIERAGAGVLVSLDILSGNTGNVGDLRGLFFDFAGFDPLEAFTVVGAHVTGFGTEVSNLGGGNNVNPLGPFDIGVTFGSSGIGSDDIRSTSFLFTTASGVLESDFFGQSVVARVTSVGPEGSARNGSSKVAGVVPEPSPVPLPGSGLLVLAGLGALAGLRRAVIAG